jgi:multidrug efflux pump subunit AcrA (membrane-fusion protein)
LVTLTQSESNLPPPAIPQSLLGAALLEAALSQLDTALSQSDNISSQSGTISSQPDKFISQIEVAASQAVLSTACEAASSPEKDARGKKRGQQNLVSIEIGAIGCH